MIVQRSVRSPVPTLSGAGANRGGATRVFAFAWEGLTRPATRIVDEVRGVNRGVYDVTSKPPRTIEWD